LLPTQCLFLAKQPWRLDERSRASARAYTQGNRQPLILRSSVVNESLVGGGQTRRWNYQWAYRARASPRRAEYILDTANRHGFLEPSNGGWVTGRRPTLALGGWPSLSGSESVGLLLVREGQATLGRRLSELFDLRGLAAASQVVEGGFQREREGEHDRSKAAGFPKMAAVDASDDASDHD
jgi:hypothetical protein